MSFSPRHLPRILGIGAALLLICHAALFLHHYRVEELNWLVLQLFDVDQENNLPTWYSELLLLTSFAFLWLTARHKRTQHDPWSVHWSVLAFGFLGLAIDEVAGVHESINSAIVMTWAIPGGVLALVIGFAFIPFLLHLPRRTAWWFACSGALYLTGAAGIEIIGNSMSLQRLSDTLPYKMTTLAEESMEMFGIVLFLHGLLDYLGLTGSGASKADLELT